MPDKIPYLLQRYLDDQLTELEYKELAAWLKRYPDDQRWVDLLQQMGMNQPEELGYDKSRWQPLVEAILQQEDISEEIPEEIAFAAPIYRMNFLRKWRWVAAAAVLLIGSSTFFLLKRTNVKQTIATVQTKEDVLPGNNKAILTLANGSKITLDSSAIGTLAQQGNTQIVAVNNGKLRYSTSTEKPAAVTYNTLTTPRGGQHQLDLSDGTRVWLNAASSITYPTAFAGKERRVQVSGEVYFEVVHNKFKPFKVDVQGTHIDDIGTSFNINAYGDENNIKTTLLEGSVEITTTKAIQIIKPGQQALTESGGSKIEISRDVDIEKVMAWHNGKIILSNVSVEQIMREISRWYDMDIEYMGTIPNKQFYGSIRRDVRLSIILNALKDYGVETTIEGKKIIVQ